MAGKVVAMEKRLLAVFTAGLGVNVSALCLELGISRQSFYKYRRRFAVEGPAGLVERSRCPHSSPYRTSAVMEEAIVRARKELADAGLDCGAQSIVWRLERQGWVGVPSVATVHRVLARRGQVVPQPHKRPRSATKRFVWPNPNDAWQIDATRWVLLGGSEAWVMDVLDDHSRVVSSAVACWGPTSEVAWDAVCEGGDEFGLPANVMSDNGPCFTGRFLGGEVSFEQRLRAAGIHHIRSTPGHPQTCGKLERWHQTLKKWLSARPLAANLTELQTQLDEFRHYYNTQRPHRALGGATPLEAWKATNPALPGEPIEAAPDAHLATVDPYGRVPVGSYLIGVGANLAGHQLLVVTSGLDVTIIGHNQIIRRLTIDPTRRYQPSGKPPGRRPRLQQLP